MSAQPSAPGDALTDLPPEVRNTIYETMRIPSRTLVIISFPARTWAAPWTLASKTDPMPIIYLNQQIRHEAASVIFQDVTLRYTSRKDFYTPQIPQILARELPCWAKYAARVEFTVRLIAPDHSKCRIIYEHSRGGRWRVSGRGKKPNDESRLKALLEFVELEAAELVAVMTAKLAEGTLARRDDPDSSELAMEIFAHHRGISFSATPSTSALGMETGVVSSTTELDKMSNSTATRDFLSAVTPEIRVMIYEHLAFRYRVIEIRYPRRATDDRAPDLPILRVNRLFRKEALPVIYKHVHLLLLQHRGLKFESFPQSILPAMPCFARFVRSMQVSVRVHASPMAWIQNHGIRVRLRYDLQETGMYWVLAEATNPYQLSDPGVITSWMRAQAVELEQMMAGFLKQDQKMRQKMHEAEYTPSCRVFPSQPY